jgi:hypothetical protein
MTPWSSVDDELPDDGEAVLIYQEDADVWMGFLDGDVWRLIDGSRCDEHEPVTHWQHLPEPPQQ